MTKEYINRLNAEMEAPDKSDVVDHFEYESTKDAKMSVSKKGTVTKHAQKEFRSRHGYNFEEDKCSSEDKDDYNKIFKSSSEKYKHIA